jgi:glyoxylase-like metal-dependent hydrolase (beta-lactamase superfamily II)
MPEWITEHIAAFRLPFTMEPKPGVRIERFVQAYLVRGTRPTLVDAGVAPAHDALVNELAAAGVPPETLSLAISTHEHADHVGGNGALKTRYSLPFACHPAARRWAEDYALQLRERPVPKGEVLFGEPIRFDRDLRDGERVDLGGLTLEVVFTPGHSPGHIALYCPEERALIAQDAPQPVGGLPLYNDVPAALASLRRLMAVKGVDHLLLGHEPYYLTGDAAPKYLADGGAYVRSVHAQVERARAQLGPPPSAEALTREVLDGLGRQAAPVVPMIVQSIEAHLRWRP